MHLPPLREELAIWPGPRAHDGQPSWTIQDPARNRFFRIDWLTFEVLQRWSLREPELIARSIGDQTPLRALVGDVAAVLEFLAANQLLKLAGADTSAALAASHRRQQPGIVQWLIHNYLFFRVPLIRPERLLAWLNDRLGFLFASWFWQVTAAAGVLGVLLAVRNSEAVVAAWEQLANLGGVAGFVVVLLAVKVVHEFGHGLVAVRFGCRVPTMGIAFLVLTPVAYTDVNEAWKLEDRRQRVLIGAAGMLAELALAVWATLAWVWLPDGGLRSAAFIVATTTWVKSLAINLSPLMRFDGYYLLSDFLDIPNLHSRCFALARWRLREWLFALGEPPPEHFRRPLARGLVALALFIWVYRLVVFLGIAIFVYHYFFKALGIVLFAVEIGWFIAIPVVSELKVWRAKWAAIRASRRTRWLGLFALLAAVLLGVPWPQRIHTQGELSPRNEFRIIAAEPAQILQFNAGDGVRVNAGQSLAQLSSPLQEYRLRLARIRESSVKAQLQAAESDPAMRTRIPTMQAAVGAAEAGRREAEVNVAALVSKAPFPGVFRLAHADLQAGEWIERQEEVGVVIGDGPWQAVGYVDEKVTHLIRAGAEAWFIPDGCPERRVRLRVTDVDRDAARQISHPLLTTPFGGALPAQVVDGNVVPERGVYRVLLSADNVAPELTGLSRRGRIVISGSAESVLTRLGRAAGAVVWREAGF